jgi:hypothetical protein
MGTVRQFRESDIPQIVGMNERLFRGGSMVSAEEQTHRFRDVCFRNPWYDERITSLVYEEGDGRISGFVAILPRRMKFKGRPVIVSVSQHLMVEPGSRSTLPAIALVQKLMSGPQDITVADMSADVSRKIWERLGGRPRTPTACIGASR